MQEDITDLVIRSLAPPGGPALTRARFEEALNEAGLGLRDPRLRETMQAMKAFGAEAPIDKAGLATAISPANARLIERALTGELAVPGFQGFAAELERLFEEMREHRDGACADYIPQLARVDPELFALSVCTVDGQTAAFGDYEDAYCVQSTCKPINYAAALSLNGVKTVHRHVGREPSGRSFNELTLNNRGLPHNPMINAGAIMCASLILPEKPLADRFDYVINLWRDLAGGARVGFDNTVYLSEKDTAHRNFALAHFMMENGAFPENTDIKSTLDYYFQSCAITLDVGGQARVAATLANGGVCPVTDKRVFSSDVVKNCLSLMFSCGMYDFSGEYAFTVGLPAKSGVSGALMIVVPGVCGITVWSPRLDALGNSVRGVAFSRALVKRFPFHVYANLVESEHAVDPTRSPSETEADRTVHLLWAAAHGDVNEIRRLAARGVDLDAADYDGRTALHLAASEGQVEVVRYLLKCGVRRTPKDRWGGTPEDDAERAGAPAIASLLGAANDGADDAADGAADRAAG